MVCYAYYTTIFQDTHTNLDTLDISPQPTYGSVAHYARTPRSRSFMVFANSPPIPPSDSYRFYISAEERARKAANAVWVARQRELYAMEGAWPMRPEFRRWNGRIIQPPVSSPSRVQIIVRNLTLHIAVIAAAADAIKAEFRREKAVYAARKAQLAFWISRTNYRLIQCRQAVAIELRAIVAHIKPALPMVFFVFALGMVVLRVGIMVADWFDDDILQGELVYGLVKEHKSWCVMA
ncbi:hypothetical protein E0Z10_g3549 [Xylaria hypoxylon]|uniref:Uncharacterized protein n=1 Tax=Xylaria hypoxylon TaxID=37992 RepID=A0A4Z0Z1H0_9PEZI|nr:hypothetical protein E0Z10_g3549 [Xylaria hypoxylon]